jgi:MarR family transcriptional regulator, organic hydroperoxide resistance regulator
MSRDRDRALLLGEQLCFALYSASRSLIRAYDPLLKPLGITYPQYLAMLVLWEEDGISVKALGDRLQLDSGTLTPLLKRLEQQGLVARRRDTDDERVVRIDLTADGKKLRTKAKSIPLELACRAGFDVDDEQGRSKLRRLRQDLVALVARIEHAGPGED